MLKTWIVAHPGLVQYLLIPFALFALNLLLVNRTKEEEWIARHRFLHAVLSCLDAAGMNPWKLIPSMIKLVSSMKRSQVVMFPLLILPFCIASMSCVAQNPVCSEEAEVAVENAYISEVFNECREYMKYRNEDWRKECPAYKELQSKYEDQRRNWIHCR